MRCQTKLLLVSAEKTRETNARGGRWKWLLAFCIKYKLCTRQPPSSHTHTYHTPLCIISISNRVSISVCCCGLSSLYDTCGSCDAMGATSGVLACRKKNTVSMPCTRITRFCLGPIYTSICPSPQPRPPSYAFCALVPIVNSFYGNRFCRCTDPPD